MNRILIILLFLSMYSCSEKLNKTTAKMPDKLQGMILEKSITKNTSWNRSGIKGILLDFETNDTLKFWGIEYSNKLESGRLTTNEVGYFSIDTLMGGFYLMEFKYIGCKVITIDSLFLKKGEIVEIKIGLPTKCK